MPRFPSIKIIIGIEIILIIFFTFLFIISLILSILLLHIIRIKVKGYLRNITDNEIFEFEERGIKNKDKITFNNNDIKYSIKCNDNEIMMIRDGNDFVNTFIFNNNNSKSNYLLKENGYDMDMEVNVSNMKSNDKLIYIEYEIVSTSCKYEFKIEMSEML